MVGLQEKAIENLLCLIPTKVFMRKNENKHIIFNTKVYFFNTLSISTDIYFRNTLIKS